MNANLTGIILASFALISSSISMAAQNSVVDDMYIDTRAYFEQNFENEGYSSHFTADHLNLNIFGHVSDNLRYRVRQKLNKKVFDERNIFNATDFLILYWDASPKWTFAFGKEAVQIGGYEYDAVPIDVYFYSRFCRNIYQGFCFGASAQYTFADDQKFIFQVCNSPMSAGLSNRYAYNLAWRGRFAPWLETVWSTNIVEDEYARSMHYIALGNHMVFGGLAVDLDLMNRASFDQEQFFFSDWTAITKVIWSVGRWNICGKLGYEANRADNVDRNGIPYDLAFEPGTHSVYGGCGLEYFPLDRKRLRLHAVWFKDSFVGVDNFDIGVTWRFDLVGRKQ